MVGGAAATFDPATDTTALVNAGTYYLYITGQNGYSGKIQKQYVIAQKDISDAAVEVTLQDVYKRQGYHRPQREAYASGGCRCPDR